jgi:hypothetical protein
MRIFEIILVILVVAAIFMRFLFIPGTDEILMISLTLLGTLYFAGGALVLNHVGLRATFKGALSNIAPVRIIVAGGAGIALSIICIGTLFKILELTGADEELLIGCVFMAVIILAGVLQYFKYKDAVAKFFLVRTVLALGIGLFLLLTPAMTLVNWRFHAYPDYIQASEEYYKNPRVDSLLEKRELEYFRIVLPEDAFKKYESEYNAKHK